MTILSRRQFLGSTAAALGVASLTAFKPSFLAAAGPEFNPTTLRIEKRTIDVLGKAADAYRLVRPGGSHGIIAEAGRQFQVRLENAADEPTLIHWHGLLPPYGQDGVPDLPQPLLQPGQGYGYDFPLETPGTHWMHAHTLQEQELLAAPLIVEDPADRHRDEQEVIVLLHDFSFKAPGEILAGLTGGEARGHGGAMAMMGHGGMPGMGAATAGVAALPMDINDVEYDAYLANDRTLEDPEVFRVEAGGRVRLRLINGATATAFWIDLGELAGNAVAVDGNPIKPVAGSLFPLGMGQRIDIRLSLPAQQGAWPILALREGASQRTGFLLATKDAAIRRTAARAESAAAALDMVLEARLTAKRPLTDRPADRTDAVVLGGDMAAYAWTLDSRTWGQHRPIRVRSGERVELTLRNQSMMGHPMHLHGHHFQVVAVNGRRIAGAVRDTVWLPPMAELTLAFDAANPGVWAFHCHHLYHMATGMMTSVEYDV